MRFGVVIILLLSGIHLSAQEMVREPFRTPILGDHNFVINPEINPFILSKFQVGVGYASTDFQFTPLTLPDTVLGGLDGELIFISANFKYKHKIRDWIGFFLNINMATRVGSELESFFSQGVNTLRGFNVGWMVKLKQSKKTLVTGVIQLRNEDVSILSFNNYVNDLLNGIPNPSVSRSVTSLTGGVGIEAAYAINDLFGLTGLLGANVGESFQRGDLRATYQFGLGGDVNFFDRLNIPLGLNWSYVLSTIPSLIVEEDFSSIITTRLAYTGSNDFRLGINLVSGKVPLPDVERKARFDGISISSTYFFR